MSDVKINSRSPYYIEANATEPTQPVIPPPVGNEPPEVYITISNDNPYLGEVITLTAVASDPDGTIVSYEWGGFGSGTTESITATNLSLVQDQIFMVTVTDNDGNTATALGTVSWKEEPQVTQNETTYVYCGDVINEASFSGTKTYNLIGVEDKVGEVEIEFLTTGGNQDVPVKFDITWNGITNTSGFIGDSNQGGVFPIPPPNNTTNPTNKKQPTTLTINKTAETPTEVILTAEAFFPNDTYSFRLNCPDVATPQTFYHTLKSTCVDGSTTFTYTDVDGVTQTVVVPEGESLLVSAQENTVVETACTGEIVEGGISFDKGVPEQEYDENTEINIIFDDSGSMDGTLQPLLDMADGLLKDKLLSFYGGDVVKYNERVNVFRAQDFNSKFTKLPFLGSPTQERFLKFASYGKTNPQSTKNIYLFFTDEVSGAYQHSAGQLLQYNYDLADYRSYLNSIQYGEHFMRTFIVEQPYGTSYTEFLKAIFDGGKHPSLGSSSDFSGSKGLSDRSEASRADEILKDGVQYTYIPGVPVPYTPESYYYYDFIIKALQDYGFNI